MSEAAKATKATKASCHKEISANPGSKLMRIFSRIGGFRGRRFHRSDRDLVEPYLVVRKSCGDPRLLRCAQDCAECRAPVDTARDEICRFQRKYRRRPAPRQRRE